MAKLITTYRGHEIFFLDAEGTYEFITTEINKTFASMKEIKDSIDRIADRLEKVSRPKLNLKVVTHNNLEATITGIHAANGRFLVSPKTDNYNPHYYPQCDAVDEFLREKIRLEGEMNRITGILNAFELKDGGFTSEDGEHPNQLNGAYIRVEATHAKLVAKAKPYTLASAFEKYEADRTKKHATK